MKVTIVAAARPNFMKIAPIVHAIETVRKQGQPVSSRLVYTGTEQDASLDASLFADLQMKAPDAYLGVDTTDPIQSAAHVMIAFDRELKTNPASVVLVVDDLTATMSCTIVARKRNIKVAHLVAGTRSFDLYTPKEVNRIITDGLSDYLFTAGMAANRNLNQTGTEAEHVYHVGNILIDTIRSNRGRLIQPLWFPVLGLKPQEYLLLTINRRSLLEDEKNLKALLTVLINNARRLPIIAPLHAYVRDAVERTGIAAPHLHILPPQSYLSFGYLMNNANAIITDSGNVAEEATFLGIPCMTLNNYAEHPETYRLGTNELVGESPEALDEAMQTLMAGKWKTGSLPERWDGRTAERIVRILLSKSSG
ncbi:MAG: UDP-N-acetyl glucosamine 2-epimerase [Mediterranea sp.]|nr:UDP-N-acetyl glucosamine 2-epimerase [Mediterranea sp.]